MGAKLGFAAAFFGLLTLASGAFLGTVPTNGGIMNSIAMFKSKDVSAKDLEEMEKAIEDLVTNGNDPTTKMAVKQMSDFVAKTLIPNRERSQKFDQQEIDTKFHALEKCHLDERVRRDANAAGKVSDAEDHKDDYKDELAKHGMCLEILEGKELVKAAKCSSVEDPQKVCECDKRMLALFGPPPHCDGTQEIAPANKKCCDAYYNHAKANNECSVSHTDAQYAEKQHGIIMGKLCDTYDKCYDEKLKDYKASEKLAKEAEARRSWAMVFRMQCLVKEFEKGAKVSKKAAAACKEKKYEVKGIEYPALPAKDCDSRI